jgi:hypothetical protein
MLKQVQHDVYFTSVDSNDTIIKRELTCHFEMRSIATIEKSNGHSEPFDFAQDRLCEESFAWLSDSTRIARITKNALLFVRSSAVETFGKETSRLPARPAGGRSK